MKTYNVLIVSGYSGAGKTYALKYLEASGYYCVDNLPIKLLESFMKIYKEGEVKGAAHNNIAIGVDIRSTINFNDCKGIIDDLKKKGCKVTLLFMTADKQVLIQRYQETRNAHPLTMVKTAKTLEDAIEQEISLLEPLRREADLVIDTSNSTVHELRQQIFSLLSLGDTNKHKLILKVTSFGFSKGIPTDVDLLFDVRFLPNPHFDPALRPLTGMDKPVAEFLEEKKVFVKFWEKLSGLLDMLVPEYTKEGKSYLTIGVGCTGGRHRSVMIAQKIAEYFELKGYKCIVEHRDIYMPHS
jgi:UPF0042 nucleotide-binding protein